MISPQFEIQLIAVVTSLACTLAGTFLVLRKMAMMSDAISHSILAGSAIAFLYTKDIHSPLLIVAATATGLVTVFLVEILKNTNLVSGRFRHRSCFYFTFQCWCNYHFKNMPGMSTLIQMQFCWVKLPLPPLEGFILEILI